MCNRKMRKQKNNKLPINKKIINMRNCPYTEKEKLSKITKLLNNRLLQRSPLN